ncbi:hypothetical protein Slin15195_G038440 [Septoria linicola]|uniref:Uncharacterized protein n=1 Tax=Septoria linicola TaxID=215465 RepID=A0A9Q9AK63_9PEZI|nr:hypothetical protein Slin14017_G119840 [Septoria linicola]USW50525.1 hypothetical protein Slin15195_G038440 [Septoria linicola]
MAKKLKPQTIRPASQDQGDVTVTIPSGTRSKNIAILFVRGAMMRIPLLLAGCLVLWFLKEYGIVPPAAELGPGEKRPFIEFSVMQVFAVNIFSEACVKVWMRLLQEKEKKA